MGPPQLALKKVEHLEDFTAHEWCNELLSHPSITYISKRQIPDKREGVSNTFFTRTLFTDSAIRAFLSLYRPGKGHRREPGEDVFTGNAPVHKMLVTYNADAEEQRQSAKEEKIYGADDPDTPEAIMLVSLGKDVDGGIRRLHGGVTASLLDQVMGTLISYVYENTSATSDLNVKYKLAVTTPCILLVRAKIIREKGRWIETRGWVEDGQGRVFAEGWGAFVMSKVGNAKM
jgi:acyl-coenzyme A thioesterase PaaI-like protein